MHNISSWKNNNIIRMIQLEKSISLLLQARTSEYYFAEMQICRDGQQQSPVAHKSSRYLDNCHNTHSDCQNKTQRKPSL